MSTPEDEYKDHLRRRREERRAELEALPEEEKARLKQLSEDRKARIQSRSSEESEAIRLRASNLFEPSFGKGPPLRYGLSQEDVTVPEDLREFMVDVHQRIQAGDESATIPSDDFLQSKRAYGGLDKTLDRFSFVYFAGKGHSIRWEFRLMPGEIEEIAVGRMDRLNVQRFESI